jgi:Tol biopolymer transport system component
MLAAIALTMLVAPAAGAAADEGLVVAFTALTGPRDHRDVVLLSGDGRSVLNLTAGLTRDFDADHSPTWAPDGERLAFASHRDAFNSTEIYSMRADGGDVRRLTFDSGNSSVYNIDPAWSPDGLWIAWLKQYGPSGQRDVWVMRPDGSDQRRLTVDGGNKTRPQWSPNSAQLLYTWSTSRTALVVVDLAGGSARSLTPPDVWDSGGVWSPDGSRIAYLQGRTPSVMNADGTARRRLTTAEASGSPAWSPDGRQLAIAGLRYFPELSSRYGSGAASDVHVINADGSGMTRLTGPFDPGILPRSHSSSPTWWPDGRRIVFVRSGLRVPSPGRTYMMNADGTCETPFGPQEPRLVGPPAWRPGRSTTSPPIGCADLVVRGELWDDAVALRRPATFGVSVENDGNETADVVSVRVTAARGIIRGAPLYACTAAARNVTCLLRGLPPKEGRALDFSVASAVAGALTVRVTASAAGDDVEADDSVDLRTIVLPCTIAGGRFADTLRGTAGRDRICGRAGWDRIFGRGGDDSIDGGSGDDRIDPGAGRDVVSAGRGSDVVLARDGVRDAVACGPQRDVVVADGIDRVAGDCEQVYRR